MKILVFQYEMLPDGSLILPSCMNGQVNFILPQEVSHIVIQKQTIVPVTVYSVYGVDENELERM